MFFHKILFNTQFPCSSKNRAFQHDIAITYCYSYLNKILYSLYFLLRLPEENQTRGCNEISCPLEPFSKTLPDEQHADFTT